MSENNVSPAGGGGNDKVFAVLAYLGILVLVPIFGAKDSKFARFHANQGLVLILSVIAGFIASGILSVVFTLIKLYFIGFILFAAVYILWLVLVIIGIINAVKGEEKPLPIVGKFTILK